AAARARFKSALGIPRDAPDPPWPAFPLGSTALPPESELWRRAAASNPARASARAAVALAAASSEVARKGGSPDFALGLMADLKASPLMLRPSASLSLPVWRKKTAATIASANARQAAASARLDAASLDLAANFARSLFNAREAARAAVVIQKSSLPNLARSIASAEAAYQSGEADASALPNLRLADLSLRMQLADTLRDRELAVTDLLLMAASSAPPDAPGQAAAD
ncbi:MAG: TolC family protein, partial [Opitutaceae bacterium]|nr:TolC family protein [Opitutaceae bacterium]